MASSHQQESGHAGPFDTWDSHTSIHTSGGQAYRLTGRLDRGALADGAAGVGAANPLGQCGEPMGLTRVDQSGPEPVLSGKAVSPGSRVRRRTPENSLGR